MKPLTMTPERRAEIEHRAKIIADAFQWCIDKIVIERGGRVPCLVCERKVLSREERARVCAGTKARFYACMMCFDLLKELREEDQNA